jgi:hypothetical protein
MKNRKEKPRILSFLFGICSSYSIIFINRAQKYNLRIAIYEKYKVRVRVIVHIEYKIDQFHFHSYNVQSSGRRVHQYKAI